MIDANSPILGSAQIRVGPPGSDRRHADRFPLMPADATIAAGAVYGVTGWPEDPNDAAIGWCFTWTPKAAAAWDQLALERTRTAHRRQHVRVWIGKPGADPRRLDGMTEITEHLAVNP